MTSIDLEHLIAQAMRKASITDLLLAGVSFWIPESGALKGQLHYDIPAHRWNIPALTDALLARMIGGKVKIKIEVTDDDIKNGRQYDCTCCPIALAAKRAYPQALWFEVHTAEVSFTCNRQIAATWLDLPEIAQKFIKSYDSDRNSVVPISFELSEGNY